MFGDASFVLPCETEHLAGAFTRRSMRRLWIVRQSWARSCRMGARNRALVSRKKKEPGSPQEDPGRSGQGALERQSALNLKTRQIRAFGEPKRVKLETRFRAKRFYGQIRAKWLRRAKA